MFAKRFVDTVLHRDKSEEKVTAEISEATQRHECAVSNLAHAISNVFDGDKPKALKVAPAP